jgi:hypothetical protein
MLGLSAAVAFAFAVDRSLRTRGGYSALVPPSGLVRPTARPLSPSEQAMAKAAWAYLQANTRPTGLVDSVAGFPGATMWDEGSALLGLLAARKLDLLPQAEYEARAGKLLAALESLPLLAEGVPNKSYNTATKEATDYANKPAPKGIGWSALDIGRMGVALGATARSQPNLAGAVARVQQRWKLGRVVHAGELWGLDAQGALVQEGRVGYAQYGSRGVALLGKDPYEAIRPEVHVRTVFVDNRPIPADDRMDRANSARIYVTSEPYVLYGLEIGLEGPMLALGHEVFEAQEAHAQATGRPVAVSEDHLDRAPYFVYNTVWSDGQPWACVTDKGEARPQDRTLSTKAALGLAVLFPGGYADRLRGAVEPLATPKGMAAGRYDEGGATNAALTANTNGVVLEALAFQAYGPILGW